MHKKYNFTEPFLSGNEIEYIKDVISNGFFGGNGGKAKKLASKSVIIPSKNTAYIQEEHMFIFHYVLNEVEKKLKTFEFPLFNIANGCASGMSLKVYVVVYKPYFFVES